MDDDKQKDNGSIDYDRFFLYLSLFGICVISWILFFFAASKLIDFLF